MQKLRLGPISGGHLAIPQNKAGLNYKSGYTAQPFIWLSFEYLQELGILQLFLEPVPVLKHAMIIYIFIYIYFPPLYPSQISLDESCSCWLLSFHGAFLRGACFTLTCDSPLHSRKQQLHSPLAFSSPGYKTPVLQTSPH